MVRSHALYPIELRAHRDRLAFSNYSGNRIVSSNRIVVYVPEMDSENALEPSEICALNPVKCRAGCRSRGRAEREHLQVNVKVSDPAQNLPAPAFYRCMLAMP